MKQIKNLIGTTSLMLLTFFAGYSQNAIKHLDHAQNVNMDYMTATDEYVMSGNAYPLNIAGMNNVGPSTTISRIQLEVLDNQLNSQWFRTYCTAQEVNDYNNMLCSHLTTFFTTGDAKQTSDGGFIICGRVRVDGETSGCSGPQYDHLFLLKTDGNGNVQWYKRYYDPSKQYGMLNSVVEASNGNFIAVGYENYGSNTFGLILGTDASGGLLWSNYSQTRSWWDANITVPSIYYEITPYNDDYAIVGIANTAFGVNGGTILTVIDANGTYLADNILDNERWGYTLIGKGIHDANDNDVAITGLAGTPCLNGAQVMLLKINPLTLAVSFFNVYSANNLNDVSWGNSVVLWGSAGGNFSITGRDPLYGGTGSLYLETDYNGNLLRYVPFAPADASEGLSVVWNSTSGFPVHSGVFEPSIEPTYVVRNNYGSDCPSDISMPVYTPPIEDYAPANIPAPFIEVEEDLLVYDMSPIESIVCGQLKPGRSATTVNDIEETHTGLLLAPNPANDYFDVNGKNISSGLCEIKVYDVTGRLVIAKQIENQGHSMRINVSSLSSGTYILNIVGPDGIKEHATVIKN